MALPKEMSNDFASADAYLGPKHDRPAPHSGHNVRIVRRGPDAIAVMLHATDVVTYHRDGTQTLFTGGWWTVTTAAKIRDFSVARLWSVRVGGVSTWAVHHDSDPLTPEKIQKCRACHGAGKVEQANYCHPTYEREPYRRIPCEHGEPSGHYLAPTMVECWRCDGEGRRDYGSNPVPTLWTDGTITVDSTGKVVGA